MDLILENIMCSTIDDEPRFRKIIKARKFKLDFFLTSNFHLEGFNFKKRIAFLQKLFQGKKTKDMWQKKKRVSFLNLYFLKIIEFFLGRRGIEASRATGKRFGNRR